MAKNYSKNDIENWKFDYIDTPEEWTNHLGNIWANFRMLIQGPSGHGKTEYLFKLCKMLSMRHGKVNFNSTEQGKHPSFQAAWFRNGMNEIEPGKFFLADKSQIKFDKWIARLKRPNSGKVIVLDSIDYMNITVSQYKELHETFKGRKSIISVCWDDPMATVSKQIKYMCDLKVDVKDFKATMRGRAGGNKTYTIWDNPDAGGLSDGKKVSKTKQHENQLPLI